MRKLFFFALVLCGAVRGQSPAPVITAFPSLRIPASSRGLAMGDGGIASATENNQVWYNVAKSAFIQNFHQVAVNYTPWLQSISNDTRFINLNYLGNVFNTSALGLSVSYLDLGRMTTRDNNGATIAEYRAREYNVGVSYGLQLNEQMSLGLSLRLLGQNMFTDAPKNVFSVCGDISYYQFARLSNQNQKIEWGVVVSNIGPKLNVDGSASKTFLPTNLGIGVSYVGVNDNDGSQLTAAIDLNKLLVPSVNATDKGIFSGMFSSFSEPDQFKTIRISTGIEYGYMNQFFLRGGLSLENKYKGNRTYFGLGVGYKGLILDQSWGIDFHYLVPFGTIAAVSPFQNSFGFSLGLSFGNFQ